MRKILLIILVLPIFLAGCVSDNRSYSEYDYNYKNYRDEPSENIDDGCCKHCTKGKACGDSCISVSYTCHKGPGCACDY